MRVFLVDPQFIERRKSGAESVGGVLPSLGILSLASVLRKEHEVAVLDCQFHSYDSAAKEMRRFSPDLVAIPVTTPWIEPALRLARVAKGIGALVVLGGPYPTVNPDGCLADSAVDAVAIGEAEETMAEFCRAVEEGKATVKVRGMAFKRNGTTLRTKQRPVIPDLDTLPMHAWDLVPTEKYMAPFLRRKRKESIALVTSRGCPWCCSFCDRSLFGHRFRARSPGLIIEEMRHLHDHYGKSDFMFFDDIFTFPRRRIEEFCRLLIKEKSDFEWSCAIRADLVDKSLLELMRKAGCYLVSFGVESGNNEVLKRINKQLTVKTIIKTAHLIKEAGLRSRAYFILGFPGETEQEVLDTVRLAKSLPVDYPSIQFLNVFPGAAIYGEAVRKGHLLGKVECRDLGLLREIDYVPDTLSLEFLLSAYKHAYRHIYWHPRRVVRYLWNIRSLDDVNKAFCAAMQIWRLGKVPSR